MLLRLTITLYWLSGDIRRLSKMEWEEVMALRQAIPIRFPEGDPRNIDRIIPERRFKSALRRYKREHGKSWFGQEDRDYNLLA